MKIHVNDDLSVRKIQDEIFILDRSEAVLHTFNGTGALIWEKIADGVTFDQIAEAVQEHYEVQADQAKEDVFYFITELQDAGLITFEK